MRCGLLDTSGNTILMGMCDEHAWLLSAAQHAHTPESASQIAGLFDSMLKDGGVTLDELTHLGIGCGPGSFIGTRTGAAFANGLAGGRALPIVPVSSLHAAVASTTFDAPNAVVVRSARRKAYFVGYYRGERVANPVGSERELLTEEIPELLKRLGELAEEGGVCMVTDSEEVMRAVKDAELPPRVVTVLRENIVDLRGLARLAVLGSVQGHAKPWVDVSYVRPVL